jgi:hypothetical protein
LACDLAIHGVFEHDRPDDVVAVEAGAFDDPTPHGVHQHKHLIVV